MKRCSARPTARADERAVSRLPAEVALHESFAAADVFLVSLEAGIEGYIVPSKVYGILAAGRPYIAAVAPACEAAGSGAGISLRAGGAPGDPDDLARHIHALYDDPAGALTMGANARRAALQFDRRVAVQAYFDLFTRVRTWRGPHDQAEFDALVGAGLLVSAPLWILIPAAIKLEDGGPVSFRRRASAAAGRCSRR